MRIRERILWLALVVVVAVAGVWWWTGTHHAAPQIITLPNGDRYEFAGTTYSTRNVPPSLAAKIVSWLPARQATLARKYFGAQITQFNEGEDFVTPRLFLWFRRLGNHSRGYSYFDVRLADQAGVESGTTGSTDFAGAATWSYACFPVAPRRSRMLQCTFYDSPSSNKATNSKPVAQISIPNPLYGRFPQWQPEPVPEVKHAGDLEVQLTDLRIDKSSFPGNSRNTQVGFNIFSHSPGNIDPGWIVHRYELSDATGNKFEYVQYAPYSLIGISIYAPRGQTSFSEHFWGTLWPDESAWRLKVKFKRPLGFIPEELVTFKNVPVPAMGTTNKMQLTQTIGGAQVMLTEFALKPSIIPNPAHPLPVGGWIRVELPGKPDGVALNFWKLRTDTGTAFYDTCTPLDFSYMLYLKSISPNAKTVEITMAVQKLRSVEFLVKPPKPE